MAELHFMQLTFNWKFYLQYKPVPGKVPPSTPKSAYPSLTLTMVCSAGLLLLYHDSRRDTEALL